MPKKPIIIVLSDWDNTMMASAARFYQVLKKTADELHEQGIKLQTPIPAISTKPHDGILNDLFGIENFYKAKTVFQIHYDQIFSPDSLGKMQMFPGVKEMLNKVPDAQVYLGIISSHYVEGKPEKKDGIKDHLERKNIDITKIQIIGVDTLEKHGYPQKQHVKPNTTSGELALRLWGIDPKTQVIKCLMFGDGKSDMEFAKNMDKLLKAANQSSSCTGVLFNTVLSGDPIFSEDEVVCTLGMDASCVAMGYGRLFAKVKYLLSAVVL